MLRGRGLSPLIVGWLFSLGYMMAVNEDDSGDGADVVMMIMVMLTGVMGMEVMVFLSRPHCKAPMGNS